MSKDYLPFKEILNKIENISGTDNNYLTKSELVTYGQLDEFYLDPYANLDFVVDDDIVAGKVGEWVISWDYDEGVDYVTITTTDGSTHHNIYPYYASNIIDLNEIIVPYNTSESNIDIIVKFVLKYGYASNNELSYTVPYLLSEHISITTYKSGYTLFTDISSNHTAGFPYKYKIPGYVESYLTSYRKSLIPKNTTVSIEVYDLYNNLLETKTVLMDSDKYILLSDYGTQKTIYWYNWSYDNTLNFTIGGQEQTSQYSTYKYYYINLLVEWNIEPKEGYYVYSNKSGSKLAGYIDSSIYIEVTSIPKLYIKCSNQLGTLIESVTVNNILYTEAELSSGILFPVGTIIKWKAKVKDGYYIEVTGTQANTFTIMYSTTITLKAWPIEYKDVTFNAVNCLSLVIDGKEYTTFPATVSLLIGKTYNYTVTPNSGYELPDGNSLNIKIIETTDLINIVPELYATKTVTWNVGHSSIKIEANDEDLQINDLLYVKSYPRGSDITWYAYSSNDTPILPDNGTITNIVRNLVISVDFYKKPYLSFYFDDGIDHVEVNSSYGTYIFYEGTKEEFQIGSTLNWAAYAKSGYTTDALGVIYNFMGDTVYVNSSASTFLYNYYNVELNPGIKYIAVGEKFSDSYTPDRWERHYTSSYESSVYRYLDWYAVPLEGYIVNLPDQQTSMFINNSNISPTATKISDTTLRTLTLTFDSGIESVKVNNVTYDRSNTEYTYWNNDSMYVLKKEMKFPQGTNITWSVTYKYGYKKQDGSYSSGTFTLNTDAGINPRSLYDSNDDECDTTYTLYIKINEGVSYINVDGINYYYDTNLSVCEGVISWRAYAESGYTIDSPSSDTISMYLDRSLSPTATKDNSGTVDPPTYYTLDWNMPEGVSSITTYIDSGNSQTSNTASNRLVKSGSIVTYSLLAADNYNTPSATPASGFTMNSDKTITITAGTTKDKPTYTVKYSSTKPSGVDKLYINGVEQSSTTVNEGDNATWKVTLLDGWLCSSSTSDTLNNITSDKTIAIPTPDLCRFSWTLDSNILSVTVNGTSYISSDEIYVNKGSNVTWSATAKSGYTIAVNASGTVTVNSPINKNITTSTSTYNVSWGAIPTGVSKFKVDNVEKSANGSVTVSHGGSVSWSIELVDGYESSTTSGTLSDITSNKTITIPTPTKKKVEVSWTIDSGILKITVDKDYTANGKITVDYGSTVSWSATAKTGYRIVGSSSGSVTAPGSITVKSEAITCTLSVTTSGVTNYTINGSTYTSNKSLSFNYGTTINYSYTPTAGYCNESTSANSGFTLTADKTLSITCTPKDRKANITSENCKVEYKINSGSWLTAGSSVTFKTNETFEWRATANSGYHLTTSGSGSVGADCGDVSITEKAEKDIVVSEPMFTIDGSYNTKPTKITMSGLTSGVDYDITSINFEPDLITYGTPTGNETVGSFGSVDLGTCTTNKGANITVTGSLVPASGGTNPNGNYEYEILPWPLGAYACRGTLYIEWMAGNKTGTGSVSIDYADKWQGA